jgi:hypothetical protein
MRQMKDIPIYRLENQANEQRINKKQTLHYSPSI